ncbi:MAG: phytanoyl-CoA dioxygenase family protein [Chitinophagaceae bacterium]|nr:phytanoyl-CoA dioxygenase family protein [Rubrivivax sp.]
MLTHTDPTAPLARVLDHLQTDGYVVLPSLLDAAGVQAIKHALAPHLQGELPGRNDFEGYKTERVYALLAKDPVFADLAAHPLVLGVCEAVLGPNFMLSACLAINTHPGETVQPLHYDDSFYHVPRPRPPYGVSAFWVIDDFTADNGPTEIIPGSHLWGEQAPRGALDAHSFTPGNEQIVEETHPDLQPVVMPAGSLMLALGTLWHRGGANRSQRPRLLITPQYCVAWGRQMESMLLSVPPEIVARYPHRVQELLGYNIHPPFMGHVNGMHPQRVLKAPVG